MKLTECLIDFTFCAPRPDSVDYSEQMNCFLHSNCAAFRAAFRLNENRLNNLFANVFSIIGPGRILRRSALDWAFGCGCFEQFVKTNMLSFMAAETVGRTLGGPERAQANNDGRIKFDLMQSTELHLRGTMNTCRRKCSADAEC